jgi:hypothetical protein
LFVDVFLKEFLDFFKGVFEGDADDYQECSKDKGSEVVTKAVVDGTLDGFVENGFFSGEVPRRSCRGYNIPPKLDRDTHPPEIHHQIEIVSLIKIKIRLHNLNIWRVIIITREYSGIILI